MSIESPQKNSAEELPNPNNVLSQPEVPNDASSLVVEPSVEKRADQKRFSPKAKLLAGLAAGATVLAGGGIALGVGLSNQAPEKQEPVATAPANPGETDEPTSPETDPSAGEITVESLQISSELSPEELGPAVVDVLNEWRMAGANQSTYNRALEYNGDVKSFAQEEAAKNSPIFAEAIFGPDWMNDAGDLNMVDFETRNNAAALESWLVTSQEDHPYEWKNVLDSSTIVSQDDSEIVIHIEFTQTNNAADNRIGTQYNPEVIELNGIKAGATITLAKVDNHYIVQLYSIDT